jgi:serine/threonine-protein kinase
MATLYLARIRGQGSFEKLLVVKRIHDHFAQDEQFIQMFLDEARITALIQHPNVATVFEMAEVDQSYYIAMEYVHGQNLTDLLRAAVRFPGVFHWSHAARIIADAAAGLHAAHELTSSDGRPLNVVHRDVSPQNLLVSYDGHVKVVDFGIAWAAERLSDTMAGTVKGKASYMAPEQVSGGKVDRRADVFSLGTVLWEAICLRRLFKEDNEAATLLKVADAQVPRPRSIRPEIPLELERILLKALAKDPAERFATAAEMEGALGQMLVTEGHYVGPTQIGAVMGKLFHDKKKIKDEQIQRAQEVDVSQPLLGVGMGSEKSSSSTILPAGALEGPARSRRTVVALWLTAGAAAVLLISLLVVILLRGSGRQAPPGPPPASPPGAAAGARAGDGSTAPRTPDAGGVVDAGAPVTPPPSQLVNIAISVRPDTARAVFRFRQKEFRGSGFRMVVPRTSEAEVVQIEAPGYKDESLLVTPAQDFETVVTLKPKAEAPRPVMAPMTTEFVKDLPD